MADMLDNFLGISDYHQNGINGDSVIIYVSTSVSSSDLAIFKESLSQIAPGTLIETNKNNLPAISKHGNKLLVYTGDIKEIEHMNNKVPVIPFTNNISDSNRVKYFTSSLDGKFNGWPCETANRIGLYSLIYDRLYKSNSTHPQNQLSIMAHSLYIESIKNLNSV
jgi:hypothetical protein